MLKATERATHTGNQCREVSSMRPRLAVGETVILLHPPLPLLGVSTGIQMGRQQSDSFVDGWPRH